MKVKKVVEVKSHYSFEAPLVPAGITDRGTRLEQFDGTLALGSYLSPEPRDTFLVRVSGESMINENIFNGDILVVDRKETPRDGKVVIASLNGEMAVKKFKIIEGKVYLYSANEKFLPIEISGLMEFQIQGVVKHVIHNM